MELRHLRYFVAAAEAKSFRGAAERIHIAQPALSRQIATLEEELGFALFDRVKRRAKLTAAGEAYLGEVRWLLREIDLAGERAARVAMGKVGVLRLGFHETAGRSRIVSDTFRDLRRKHPEIELRLSQMTSPSQIEAILQGDLDAGFVYLPKVLPPGLASRAVAPHRAWLAMNTGHPLARKAQIPIGMLNGEPFIGLARAASPVFYDALAAACRKAGLRPGIVQETQGEATTLNLVAAGLGVALVVSADQQSWTRDIVLRPIRGLDFEMRLALVWRKPERPALTDRLVEILDAILRA